jgi:IS4 transposase
LPVEIWFRDDASEHDTNFIPDLLALATSKTLLILDRGFYDFRFFADLVEKGAHFITRLKVNAKFQVVKVLTSTDAVKDVIILLGTGQNGAPIIKVRLVEVRFGRVWYRYITSVLDPTILPPHVVADLYRRRWRIEEAFNTVKRLLGLAYLWTGSINGIMLQIWATWLFYAILVDLGDAVANELAMPFDRISLEMVFRGLYHFSQAYAKGKATDPISYFAAPENQDLGIVKRLRKPEKLLNLSPYPI